MHQAEGGLRCLVDLHNAGAQCIAVIGRSPRLLHMLKGATGATSSFRSNACVLRATKTVEIPSSQMPPKEEKNIDADQSTFSKSTRKVQDFFSIPVPVKRLFDLVPVVTYPPNQLPLRAPKPARIPSLYVFSKDQDAAAGRPSFNPSCLKWQVGSVGNVTWSWRINNQQTFLNIAGVDHRLISSNNHSSPTGSLPFLLPAVYGSNTSQDLLLPIPSNRFVKYATEHGGRVDESSSMRYEAYESLLDHRIRNAWVCTLFNCSMVHSDAVLAVHTVPRAPELLSSGIPSLRLPNLFKPSCSSLNITPSTCSRRSRASETYLHHRHR